MKKKKLLLYGLAIIAVIGLSFSFFIDKVSVSASNIALKDSGWRAGFSVPLKSEAVNSGDLYIVDQSGKRVKATMELSKDGRSLSAKGLETGKYTLHVKRNAVTGGLLKSITDVSIDFTVYQNIQSVQSANELKDYFALVKKKYDAEMNNAPAMEFESTMSMDSAKNSAGSSGGGDYSTTNNQVEGVDESDIVKTDGEYIYSVVNGKVVITNVKNSSSITKASELTFANEYYPTQLFLEGDTLIVLGERHQQMLRDEGTMDAKKMSMPYVSMTLVKFYDVSNTASPELIREIGTEGYVTGARKTNDTLYFITSVTPNFWIMEQTEDVELRPMTFDSNEGEKISPMPYGDLSILPGTLEGRYSIITSVDLTNLNESTVNTKGYLGGSEQLYMSEENLYLTANVYLPVENNSVSNSENRISIWRPQNINTEIFKFELDSTNIKFVASSEVTGRLLNQFSMDEFNGYFRVVTTEGFSWDESSPSENHLFILDSGMNMVGSVSGLAKGERIYSARFMGDKAYMVTFKETDPLFVIDVATPTSPKVLGELKIPGFSNYLHPLDENHLIGFGYDTEVVNDPYSKQPRVMTKGMKISLFDVSDFANPKEKDTEIIGGSGTYSPIQYDHKALFQHREKNLYGFPISIYEEQRTKGFGEFQAAGSLIYEITPENGITLKGDLLKPKQKNQEWEEWESSVQRIMYINDALYTLSYKEIIGYNLNTFKQVGSLTINTK